MISLEIWHVHYDMERDFCSPLSMIMRGFMELVQINTTARISGNDTILDALLLRLHTETACRRGGALAI